MKGQNNERKKKKVSLQRKALSFIPFFFFFVPRVFCKARLSLQALVARKKKKEAKTEPRKQSVAVVFVLVFFFVTWMFASAIISAALVSRKKTTHTQNINQDRRQHRPYPTPPPWTRTLRARPTIQHRKTEPRQQSVVRRFVYVCAFVVFRCPCTERVCTPPSPFRCRGMRPSLPGAKR